MRAVTRGILRWVFRVRVMGHVEALAHGPGLVVAHCESALDGVLLGLFLPNAPLVLLTPEMTRSRLPRWLARCIHALAMLPARSMVLKDVVHHVRDGGTAVIFPEGQVTHTVTTAKIWDAAAMIAARCGGNVVPVRIEGSRETRYGATSARWPHRWFPRITICIGAVAVIPAVKGFGRDARRARAFALQCVMQDMHGGHAGHAGHAKHGCGADQRNLFAAFLDAVESHGRGAHIIEDARRQPETYGQLLKTALALGRMLERETQRGETVGLIMPTLSTTLCLLLGLSARGRTVAMLNFSGGMGPIREACGVAGVRTVVTSRQVLAAVRLQGIENALKGIRVLYLEDLRARLTLADQLWLVGYALWFPRATAVDVAPESAAVVLFTSGSEGTPKGVVLSHRAMLANMTQLRSAIDFGPDDKYFSALPLFHTFGLIACALMPLMTGTPLFLYVSPLRYRTIPGLVYECGATFLFGTSTFLGQYGRQAHAMDFQSVRKVICGGEKLSREVAQLWHEKFGLRVLEGYGATECGPAMSLNTPLAYQAGSVGRLLPGIEYTLVPVAGIGAGGGLHVRGPNLMSGYLLAARPGELVPPASAAGAGWHDTGDVVEIDELGFVTIAGRTRRFVKIAGEMISLELVERVAAAASPQHRHAADIDATAEHGESTVLFTTDTALTRAGLMRTARELGVPELAAARRLMVVQDLPVLGNGKIDYVSLKQRAQVKKI